MKSNCPTGTTGTTGTTSTTSTIGPNQPKYQNLFHKKGPTAGLYQKDFECNLSSQHNELIGTHQNYIKLPKPLYQAISCKR